MVVRDIFHKVGLVICRVVTQILTWGVVEPWQRRAMRLFLWDGFFIAFGAAFITTYIPLYALGMGATPGQIGLLASLQGGTAILGSLAGAWAMQRLHSGKKAAFYLNRIGDPATLMLIIAIPTLFQPAYAIYALLALQSIRVGLANAGMPGFGQRSSPSLSRFICAVGT